jgi:hypothetical protein
MNKILAATLCKVHTMQDTDLYQPLTNQKKLEKINVVIPTIGP